MASLILSFGVASQTAFQEIRPGVWAASHTDGLPLPNSRYQVYMVGETHGLQQNEEFQLQYLKQLHSASGLRDVAIEEDAVYENDAELFVEGKSDTLPVGLCLRAGILGAIRQLNTEFDRDAKIRVHLTDIDSPASAIHRHLAAIKKRLAADNIEIPREDAIKTRGLSTVARLKSLTKVSTALSELRTIELSIRSLQQGFEVDIGPSVGSPYLDSREEAVAANIVDLIQIRKMPSLLVLYGSDHVSKTPRKDGGPNRNQAFAPMALRLQQSGIRTFSVITLPLTGKLFWRGHASELPYTAEDGHLASGETFDRLLTLIPGARFIFIDTSRERAILPSQDVSRMAVDAFVLFASGTPMSNLCAAR